MSVKLHLVSEAARESDRWEPVLDASGRPIKGYRRYKATRVIYYRETFRAQGIPDFFKSTGETTIGKARTKVQIMVQRWKNRHLGIDDSPVLGREKIDPNKTVRAAVRWVLEHETPERRLKTQKNHAYAFRFIEEEFGSQQLDAVTIEGFKAWIMRLRQRKFGTDKKPGDKGYRAPHYRTSFECFSKAMNIVWRTAYERKLVSHRLVFPNPDKNLIQSRKERARRYTDNELVALWDEMNEDMRDQFVLAAECYMRLMEALKLEWARLDMETGVVTLRAIDVKTGSKTGRGRKFILSPMALERMRARYANRDPRSPYIFPNLKDPLRPRYGNKTAWRLTKKRAKISGSATWHHLRHTALSRAVLERKANPADVSEYAGVSLQTLQRTYLHADPNETRAAGVAAALPLGARCETGVNRRAPKKHPRKTRGK